MTRQIFIGSSTESLKEAEAVRTLLESFPDTKCVLWNTLFEPGSLTFEVLEQMLTRCSAAVFIATPDDQSVIRGRKIMTPRSNVVLEFGLVAGRLGRHRIALCQYGDAELPPDLRGLTVVEMGSRGSTDISQCTSDNLRIWTARLSATAEGISRTQLVHGYTGNWEFALDLTTWRDMTIVRPDYAYVKGSLQIFIPVDGHVGGGLAHGRLFFKVASKDGPITPKYSGEYHTAHKITSAVCRQDGSLELQTEVFVQHKITSDGTAPPQLDEMASFPPWSSTWLLNPTIKAGTLDGDVTTEAAGNSRGRATITRADEFQLSD